MASLLCSNRFSANIVLQVICKKARGLL